MKQIKQIKVEVTQHDIEIAIPADSRHCMIVEATKRKYGKRFTRIVADKNHLAMTDRKSGERYTFSMSASGRVGILLFDEGRAVKPFTLNLRSPKIRQRRPALTASDIKTGKKLPDFVGGGHKGAAGSIPQALPPEGRKRTGRDRVWGGRLFTKELARVRADLGVAEETKAVR